MAELVSNNKVIINQLISLIKQFSDKEYAAKLPVLNGSSIGMHTRHILEFYSCFLNQCNNTEICYDDRERQLIYEINTDATIDALSNIKNALNNLEITNSIEIKTNSSTEEGNNNIVQSSIGRELLYTLDHSIHHLAIIKIGAQLNFGSISFPENFGVAPSTIRHNNKSCAQ